jgi:hypothetical protein
VALIAATAVTCPACGAEQQVQLVRSLNSQTDAGLKRTLLDGELNLLKCACGKTTPLAADLVFYDPAANYFCQVCVGDASSVARGKKAFAEAGVTEGRRIVRSQNALIEKVKLLDAGLADWAIELLKVVLLASLPNPEVEGQALFDRVDREAKVLEWVVVLPGDAEPRRLNSPLAAYERGLKLWAPLAPADELEIDRTWAVTALRKVMPLPA